MIFEPPAKVGRGVLTAPIPSGRIQDGAVRTPRPTTLSSATVGARNPLDRYEAGEQSRSQLPKSK